MGATPTPTGIGSELTIAAYAAGGIAQAILTALGQGAIASAIPLFESLLATAVNGIIAAGGSPPTLDQWKALLGDVPLVPVATPPASAQ